MQAMKIKVNSPEHSRQLQQVLFKMGYGWGAHKIVMYRYEETPFLYCLDDGSLRYGEKADTFSNNSTPEYHLLDGKLVPVETTDSKFPFKLSQADATSIIYAACNTWKDKLLTRWGSQLLIYGSIVITEEFYQEMRKACIPNQHKLLDEIFGKDQPAIKVGDWVTVIKDGVGNNTDAGKTKKKVGDTFKVFEIDEGIDKFAVPTGDYYGWGIEVGYLRLATEDEIQKAIADSLGYDYKELEKAVKLISNFQEDVLEEYFDFNVDFGKKSFEIKY